MRTRAGPVQALLQDSRTLRPAVMPPPNGAFLAAEPAGAARFVAWCEALYARHTADLSFSEIRRALGALSDIYVHKRHKLTAGGVFCGRGKRAAFALYYAPLHYLLVAHIAQTLQAKLQHTLVDLGCGTGAGGIAWAQATGGVRLLSGFEINRWACTEATWTWRHFGQQGQIACCSIGPQHLRALQAGDGVLAAYLINELPHAAQAALRDALLSAHARGAAVLIVEPIAKSVTDFWPGWQQAFAAAGGRCDLWRVAAWRTPHLKLLGKAAGLRHDVLKGRSLYLPGRARR